MKENRHGNESVGVDVSVQEFVFYMRRKYSCSLPQIYRSEAHQQATT